MAEKPPLDPVTPEAKQGWNEVMAIANSGKLLKQRATTTTIVGNRQTSARVAEVAEKIQPKLKGKGVSMFKDKWVILGLKTMGYLLLMFAVLSIFDVWKEWSDKRTDARDVEHAKSQLEATGYDVKRETLKNGVPAKASPSNATGPVYDCNSAQSVQAGFRAGKVHYLGNADSYTMSGCLWIEADQEMGDISGQNFLIEFPLEKNSKRLDSSLYSKSPSEKNPDPTAFWNEISNNPNYQSKAVRVLVMKDGFVTITKKGN